MKTIYKQVLQVTDSQQILVPEGAEFLAVQLQQSSVSLWFICDNDKPLRDRVINMFGTGNPIEEGPEPMWLEYLGTFQLNLGELVFHVFENHLE